jgi:hypothetical protein
MSKLCRLVVGGIMTSPKSPPEDSSPGDPLDMRPAEEHESDRDDPRARALQALSETVIKMLSELNELRPSEVVTVRSRLFAALERMYSPQPDLRGAGAGFSTSIVIYLVAPVILLRWVTAKHSLLIYGILYVAILLSAILIYFIGIFIAVLFIGSRTAFNWMADTVSNPMQDVLWAWNERDALWGLNESEEEARQRRDRDNDRSRVRNRSIVAVVVIAIAAVGAVIWLRPSQSIFFEVLRLAPLTCTLAFVFGVVSFAGARISQSYNIRPPKHFWPGDATLVDLVNLAFLANRSRAHWQRFYPRWYLLSQFERAARKAEYAFSANYVSGSAADPETKSWTRDEAARLAAGFRRHKRVILLAHEPGCLDVVIESLCSGLVAAAGGNWNELTAIPAPSSRPARLKRLARFAAPPVLLILAAIFVPELIGTAAVSDTVRLSLIVAAVLALITAVSPESETAAATIQEVINRIPGGIQH